jgi:predicted nucleic acid-binding OB-fold protein
MTQNEVNYNDLIDTRHKLIQTVNKNLSEQNKQFVLSFYNFESPDWSLSPFKNIEHLPAIKWKLKNKNGL